MAKDMVKGKSKPVKKVTTGKTAANKAPGNKGKLEKAAGKAVQSGGKLNKAPQKSGKDKDITKGETRQAKDQARATTVKLTGDKTLETRGNLENAAGKIQQSFGKLKKELTSDANKELIKDKYKQAKGQVQQSYGKLKNELTSDANKDLIKGKYKQAKGQVQQTAGKILGDKPLQIKGLFGKAVGKLQESYGNIKKKVKEKDKK